MHNEQTYYAVLVSYPMPTHIRSAVGGSETTAVMDGRFFTRATTYADMYLDLRRFAIDRRLEEINHSNSSASEEVTDLSLEEIEKLVTPAIEKLVAITDPEVCQVISDVWELVDQLEWLGRTACVYRANQRPMELMREAGQLRHDLEAAVKDLMKYHLTEKPEPKQYLTELDAIAQLAYQFIDGLRPSVEQA